MPFEKPTLSHFRTPWEGLKKGKVGRGSEEGIGDRGVGGGDQNEGSRCRLLDEPRSVGGGPMLDNLTALSLAGGGVDQSVGCARVRFEPATEAGRT